jgi:hypothetical protein
MSGFHRPMLKVVMFEQHRLVVVVYERDLYVPVPCGYLWTRRALLRGLRQVLRLLEHGWMLEELSGVAMSMTHEMLIVPEADMPGGVFNLAGLRKRSCLVVHTREGTLQARPPPASRCSTRSHASGYYGYSGYSGYSGTLTRQGRRRSSRSAQASFSALSSR